MRRDGEWKVEKNQHGVSLIVALLALLILTTLTMGIIFTTQTEIWTTANERDLTQARYAAEAGVQSTINWLEYNYAAPATFTSYNVNTSPVQCLTGCTTLNAPIVLSGTSGVAANYPDATVSSAYNAALGSRSLPGVTNVSFPIQSLVAFLILSAVLGLIAATWPARRAANLDVLSAIATE